MLAGEDGPLRWGIYGIPTVVLTWGNHVGLFVSVFLFYGCFFVFEVCYTCTLILSLNLWTRGVVLSFLFFGIKMPFKFN
jgi:hypothetical protein